MTSPAPASPPPALPKQPGGGGAAGGWLRPELLRLAARFWLPVAGLALGLRLWSETAVGLTAGDGTLAFGDDAINFWAAARLAILGRAGETYDFAAFHAFHLETLGGPVHLYHYSYPPTAILVTLPLGLLPYPAGWAFWLVGGWLAFLLALRRAWAALGAGRGDLLLYALAVPPVLANAMTGQIGTWAAALLGGGLTILGSRPWLGGALLGLLLSVKPQLGLLVPFALLAGRCWAAIGGGIAAGAAAGLGSLLLFGAGAWVAYAERLAVLRAEILEDGTGVWTLMTSVFVLVRHLPAPVPVAYAAQGAAALAALLAVIWTWRMAAPQARRNAVLVVATLLTTPYLQVYDLVVAAFVPVWLLGSLPREAPERQGVVRACAPLLLAAVVSPPVARGAGLAVGCLLFVPAFILSVRLAAAGARKAVIPP